MNGRRRLSAIWVPVLLSVLTLTVFARLQDYGPDSAFRRFYQSALAGDRGGVDDTTVEGSSSEAVRELVVRIQRFERMGVRPQTRDMAVSADGASILTVYVDPRSGLRVYVSWILRLQGRDWKVAAEETLSQLARVAGP